MDRRSVLGLGAGIAALLDATPAFWPASAQAAAAGPSSGAVDLATANGNVLAMAKLTGDLAGAGVKHGYYSGVLTGVVPGEAVRELVGIVGLSSARLEKLPDEAGYLLLQKEVGFFTDLASGAVLDRWRNPYTGEEVEPFHIANPAVNRFIRPIVKDDRFYDRVAGTSPLERPFVLPWRLAGDRAYVETRTHFWANNPLDPAIWIRESSGSKIQVSDFMSYSTSYRALSDRNSTTADYWGHWVHVRPWQPWMLMGAAPGHCLYSAVTGSARTLGEVPEQILEIARLRTPGFLVPPNERRASEPSMIRYMRERKPVRTPAKGN
jgi:Protein of unknown function (DUF1838)